MSEQDANPPTPEATEPNPADSATKSKVSFRWLRKMLIVWVIFAGAGAYFAYDGFLAYPARGRAFLEFALNDYLVAAAAENNLTPIGVSVQDPADQLRRLNDTDPGARTPFEQQQHIWLTALSRVENLDAIATQNAALQPGQGSPTVFPTPVATLQTVQAATSNQQPPAPLSAYDIPSQHIIWVLCAILLAWLTAKIIGAYSKAYRFNHDTLELTLPSGQSFTPDQITDVDKRKWDKYLVFMTVQGIDGEIKFDGLKYDYLEHWVLKMEKAWPGYVPEDEEPLDNQTDDDPADDPTSESDPDAKAELNA